MTHLLHIGVDGYTVSPDLEWKGADIPLWLQLDDFNGEVASGTWTLWAQLEESQQPRQFELKRFEVRLHRNTGPCV